MLLTTRTPYKWDEISETAKHREILTLANTAGPDTRYYYDLGRYTTSVNEENWVARWYLWHSFRYRLILILPSGCDETKFINQGQPRYPLQGSDGDQQWRIRR
jgi:hypothetical protein